MFNFARERVLFDSIFGDEIKLIPMPTIKLSIFLLLENVSIYIPEIFLSLILISFGHLYLTGYLILKFLKKLNKIFTNIMLILPISLNETGWFIKKEHVKSPFPLNQTFPDLPLPILWYAENKEILRFGFINLISFNLSLVLLIDL